VSILKPFGSTFALLLRGFDAVLIVAALWGANHALGREWMNLEHAAALAAVGVFLITAQVGRLYASWRLASMDDEFRTVLIAWGVTCCTLLVGAFLAKVSANYSRLETLVWFCITPGLLIALRLVVRGVLRALRRSGKNTRTVAIVGATEVSASLIQMLEQSATFGVRLAGVYDDRNARRLMEEGYQAAPPAGCWDRLVERSRAGEIDYVFIALPMRAEQRIVELVNRLADTTASVYVVPNLFVFDLMRARWVTLGRMSAVSVFESPFDGLSGSIKRAEDIVLGTLLLCAAALPILLISLCLLASSNGSVFFRQKRYGLNGRVVRVWKFRTMTVSEDGADVVQARHRDPRITPLGSILRATSLDELPQLFNVLSGEMSLVGPRPHAVVVNEHFRRLIHGYMLRHKVKPGITGWAQVNGWHGDDTVEKMQQRIDHDLAYLQNWSLWLDLKILALTFAAVLLPRRKARTEGTSP
jgi:putative colanic acid biosysnthesis UDP-glucose lipid carrier transferase